MSLEGQFGLSEEDIFPTAPLAIFDVRNVWKAYFFRLLSGLSTSYSVVLSNRSLLDCRDINVFPLRILKTDQSNERPVIARKTI